MSIKNKMNSNTLPKSTQSNRSCSNWARIRGGLMVAQYNVGQSMSFHHQWRFYSNFPGNSHTQRCGLWMILIKSSCGACERALSDLIWMVCKVILLDAAFKGFQLWEIQSHFLLSAQMQRQHTHAHTNICSAKHYIIFLHSKMSINIYICSQRSVYVLWK